MRPAVKAFSGTEYYTTQAVERKAPFRKRNPYEQKALLYEKFGLKWYGLSKIIASMTDS